MRMWRPIGRAAANDILLTANDCGHTSHVGSCASCQRRALARSRKQLAVATRLRRETTPGGAPGRQVLLASSIQSR